MPRRSSTSHEALASLLKLSASEPAFDPVTAERHFRICMTDASHITLLPQPLAHSRTAAPLARLEATRIEAARIDADTPGLLLESAIKRARIESRVLLELPGFLGLAAGVVRAAVPAQRRVGPARGPRDALIAASSSTTAAGRVSSPLSDHRKRNA